MNSIRNTTAALVVLAAIPCVAGNQNETEKYFWGTRESSVSTVDFQSPNIQLEHPELRQPPPVGTDLSLRVYIGTNIVREITGTVISSNVLLCKNGPEIHVESRTVFSFFKALYMTDRLHQTPQTDMDSFYFRDDKPHVYFPPGDYWLPEEKEHYQLKEKQ